MAPNITPAFEGRFLTLVLKDREYSADWGFEEMPNATYSITSYLMYMYTFDINLSIDWLHRGST